MPKEIFVATTVLACVSVLTGCPQIQQRPNEVRIVDVPRDVFVPDGRAVAYRLEGGGERRETGVRLSLSALLEAGIDRTNGFLLLTRSNDRYRAIYARQAGDDLIANILTGRTYVIVPLEWGHLRRSLDRLCEMSIDTRRPIRDNLPQICEESLCAPGILSTDELAKRLNVPAGEWGFSPGRLGGWTGGASNYCDLCTKPREYEPQEPGPTLGCMGVESTQQCNNGTVLLRADFESDSIGGLPSVSPAATPADDALEFTGNVEVTDSGSSGSNALLIARHQIETRIDGILGDGATSTGSYCIRFKGEVVEGSSAIAVSFLSATNRIAWKLIIDEGEATLLSGSGAHIVAGNFNTSELNEFRFDLDLDLERFDLFIDDTPVQAGLAFFDSNFGVPARIRFGYDQPLLEFFPGSFIVDDLVVRKTN